MNQQKRAIISEYINLHDNKVIKHLRSLGLLNNNRTLPRNDGAQINLERWFLDAIDFENYTLQVTDAGPWAFFSIEATMEIRGSDSVSGNPIIFSFDAAAWPFLMEEAVFVSVENGLVNRPDVFIEPSVNVDICGDSRNESYKNLFIDDYLGAIADIPGMTNSPMSKKTAMEFYNKQRGALTESLQGRFSKIAHATALQEFVWKRIDAQKDELLKAVLQYANDLVNLDEDGNATPESHAEVTQWLDRNDLTESLQRIIACE